MKYIMIHNYQICHDNVLLKPLKEDDIELLRNWRNDANNSLFLRKIPYITPKMQKEWFENYMLNLDEFAFSISEIVKLHRVVGSLSLYQFKASECFFGKILIGDSDAHGRQVGFNATKAAIEIAFYKLNIKKVYLNVYKNNLPALHIYKAVGFEIEDVKSDSCGFEEYTMALKR